LRSARARARWPRRRRAALDARGRTDSACPQRRRPHGRAFIYNDAKLARYAPALRRCGSKVGTETDDGLGIRLGLAAGGEAIRMDAGYLVLARAFDRSRPARLGRALRRAGPAADPIAPIAAEFDDVLAPLVDPSVRQVLYSAIAERVRDARPERLQIPREDWLAAVGVFWIVFFSSLPAILPFLVFSEPRFAMRVSCSRSCSSSEPSGGASRARAPSGRRPR